MNGARHQGDRFCYPRQRLAALRELEEADYSRLPLHIHQRLHQVLARALAHRNTLTPNEYVPVVDGLDVVQIDDIAAVRPEETLRSEEVLGKLLEGLRHEVLPVGRGDFAQVVIGAGLADVSDEDALESTRTSV